MAQESLVQVAPDSTGKKIRNLSVTVLQPDGTTAVVQMQVLAAADPYGNLIDLDTKPVLEELLAVHRQTAQWLELLVGAFGGGSPNAESPSLSGYVGRTQLGLPTSVGDLVNGLADPFGRQIIVPWGARDMFVAGLPATITDTSSHTLIAGVANVFLDLALLLISNTSAATSARVDISDGTNTYPFQSVGGAGLVGFSSGLILPATTRGASWTIQASGAVTDLRVIALFVKNK